MEAFVEQIIGNKAFIKLQNGRMMEVSLDQLPKGLKVDDLLLYQDGTFISDPNAKAKKAALEKQIEELMKELFTEVKTVTDKNKDK